ncbi:class I SAM-dependent methyltransferase [soil metagenome]
MSMEGFFAVHEGHEREGPGSDDSTRRALAMVTDLPADAKVADVGCGPGAQTLVLASELPEAALVAVDLHPPFVAGVQRRAMAAGVADRVTAVVGDMTYLPAVLQDAGHPVVDVIWSEGAAYIMGFEAALAAWAPLVRPGGAIVLSEPVWIAPTVPRLVRDFWDEAYPVMQPIQVRRAQIAAAGLRRVGDFTLPVSDWEAYYSPIRARLDQFRGDPAMVETVAAHDAELAVFDGGGATSVGYQMFVVRRDR